MQNEKLPSADEIESPAQVWPVFDEEQMSVVQRVLASGKVNYWTGTEGKNFECEFAGYVGSKFALALGNGTFALDLALRALQIKPGDEVIVTPRSFMASVSTVVHLGAIPVFADVDLDSQNLTVEHIAPVITPKTAAILLVHHAGWPCDMPAIMELAAAKNIAVIEDCAQAHGAEVDGRAVGALGDVGAFSFCQDKIMTTAGEGGMMTTNDEAIFQRAQSFKDHGKNFQRMQEKTDEKNAFRYLIDSFGTNYRLTEVQSAVGRVQLKRLNQWREIRTQNAAYWRQALSQTPALRMPEIGQRFTHAHYKHYVFVELEKLKSGWNRARILNQIADQGAKVFSGSCPTIYKEKAFDDYPHYRPASDLPNARRLGETSLMVQVDPTMTRSQIQRDANVIDSVLRSAVK